MAITMPGWVKRYLFLERVLRSIDSDNVVERQRFILFRWFTLLAVWTCLGMFTEVYASIPIPLVESIPILITAFLANYLLLQWHKNKRAAYFVLVTLIFAEIHITSYFTGGIQNNAFFFNASTLLCAFMLLGTRAGFLYSVFVIANQFYFYFITEYTDWVTNMLSDASKSALNLDYLITGSLSLIVISVQLISLEGSKSYVLKKLNHSKNELKERNIDLKKVIAERKIASELLAENLRILEASHQEMEQKNKDLDRFAYIVSHDLKAPLRAIGSMTRFIEEDAAEKLPKETHHYLELIRGRIMRMERLISDILTYSQSTRSKKSFTEFKLNDLVLETIDLIMLPANCKVITHGGDTVMTGDKTRLKQVVLNLVVNAVKHHHDKDNIAIEISVTDEMKHWHLSIRDNGPGIDENNYVRIFEIFQTLQKDKDSESTGIGLAIVKKIIEDLHGKIWIESELGKGTVFHFTLPKEKSSQPVTEGVLVSR